ncbi:MAG TPA: T9SS type A sorting domain-containing protein [Ignavibacteria bacterium]|nr:T9SS type A sorting domain-containing protein [Ignavibacteria bacterium]
MKKLFALFFIITIGFVTFTGQKFNDDERKWDPDPRYTGLVVTGYTPLPQLTENYIVSSQPRVDGPFVISANFRPYPTTNTNQSEVIITRHPTNQNILWASCNMTTIGGTLFISEGTYVSTNGGANWFGSDTLAGAPIGNHGGDPGPAIDKDGRLHMTHLGYTTSGMFANYSTNNGLTWSNTFTIASGSQDKNFAGTDDAPSSPYYGRTYCVWSWFPVSAPWAAVSYTTNGGVSWSTPAQINTPPAGHYSQGTDIRVGPNGEVYVCWAAPTSSSPFTEDYLGFAKSTNGGVNWTVTENAYDMNGIRGTFSTKSNIRVNGFPRIDVDRSGGARNGWIYVVSAERNLSPAGTDPDIVLHRSSNGGTNWSPGIRVNQDPLNNGKYQWFPAIRVDETGGINVVYYDDRQCFATPSDSTDVYMSRSVDGGNTWTDVKVSDGRFKPGPITGLAGGYQGDYIGITSGNSKVWPVWADKRTGIYQLFTASVTVANNPLNPFNLQTPAAGVTLNSLPGGSTLYNVTWDTSALGSSYKWIFGSPNATNRQITLPSGTNSLSFTAGQLDVILANLGVAQGNQLVGQWDVWAFRPNPPQNDSLKASNGPRAITLRRAVPTNTPVNLISPPNNSTVVTSVFNSGNVNINWSKSGEGVTYKWMFDAPNFAGAPLLSYASNNNGFDTSLTIVNSTLDGILGGLGLNPGDSVVGQWRVYAFRNATDSAASNQTYNITFKRQAKGDVVVVYDSTVANCRISRDSIIAGLNGRSITYDLFNRGSNTATLGISFRGYKKVILLGEGTSVASNRIKDSLKTYLSSGGSSIPTKSKLIIFGEDVGYHWGRSASTYYDLDFVSNTLGWTWVSDRPTGSTGPEGLRGVAINVGLKDSTSGPWPDVLAKSTVPSLSYLYEFTRVPGNYNGVGRMANNFNVATLGVDFESLKNSIGGASGSPQRRWLYGALDYVDQLIPTNIEDPNGIPTVYELSQNFPNPFNPVTKINFSIPKQGMTTLKVYDVTGRLVASLINEIKAPGFYSVNFEGTGFASGAYFYKLESLDFSDVKRMILVK